MQLYIKKCLKSINKMEKDNKDTNASDLRSELSSEIFKVVRLSRPGYLIHQQARRAQSF